MNSAAKWIVTFSFVVFAGCGGNGSGSGNASCSDIIRRYETCGVYTGGIGRCYDLPERAFDKCFALCTHDATCAEMNDYGCNGVPNTCMSNCLDGVFTCTDGSTIEPLRECDGVVDCADGSDEGRPCKIPDFRCAQKEKVPASEVCDGVVNCSTGLDEAQCGDYICAAIIAAQDASEPSTTGSAAALPYSGADHVAKLR